MKKKELHLVKSTYDMFFRNDPIVKVKKPLANLKKHPRTATERLYNVAIEALNK